VSLHQAVYTITFGPLHASVCGVYQFQVHNKLSPGIFSFKVGSAVLYTQKQY